MRRRKGNQVVINFNLQMDIAQQNFITAERNNPIPNVNVTHVAFSLQGTWLATTESRKTDERCNELRLKFWKYEKERQL